MIEKSSSSLERTVLVGIITLEQPKIILEEYLNELNFLTYTAGGTVVKRFTQKMDSPDPKTFLGKGKMEELSSYIKIHDINSVISEIINQSDYSKKVKVFDLSLDINKDNFDSNK